MSDRAPLAKPSLEETARLEVGPAENEVTLVEKSRVTVWAASPDSDSVTSMVSAVGSGELPRNCSAAFFNSTPFSSLTETVHLPTVVADSEWNAMVQLWDPPAAS